ncbi:aldehyde dehydrogenase (NADP(+)) [Thalassococcus lentus]|uniref:Aldehyde dehydrogenase (NADP(+)) n=1 Tax=Thalassococcus lentus TaxID=1210524 RepID=A0ABT4XMZ6_9RHOB|nr:aldehyde dehydrogenase (NADP(+)) [Thalassococcus lentus]MDA7423300.1 aldehyde dehydrogenase (NADP(+)) [Thalassococcus lentus]
MTDGYKAHGKHLIAGEWVAGSENFENAPVEGAAQRFSHGTPAHVDAACKAAETAFLAYAETSREARATFLEKIAEEIDVRGAQITAIGTAETGLPAARLEGERGRTCGQLRLFASHIRDGAYLDQRHDEALPDRAPLPRPDLKMVQRPIGPVAVFGASNFPLAFSTAGGDTASALAAGCPVVVKGHPAHPGTGEIIADAISAAVQACNMPAGVFSFVQGGTLEVGQALVQHPLICAVGFTGSLRGGRALYDLCAARPVPIPFFGELGSINPVFLMPAAMASRAQQIAEGWVASLTMGAGQFCTNPGVVIALDGPDCDLFVQAASKAMENAGPQTMLTSGIAEAYAKGVAQTEAENGVEALVSHAAGDRSAAGNIYQVSGDDFLANPGLSHEVFGPLGLIVRADNAEQMAEIASALEGQLTCTLQMDDGDVSQAQGLMPILERKAGRVLANGFPTGVEVAEAMVHGGPYPASTNFGHTSVGTMAIRRFLRPVCYQNMPDSLVPADALPD